MGILNATPDSFTDGRLAQGPRQALRRAEAMVREGADLIDIGGESTRPGSRAVSLDEELRRVIPVIRALATRVRVPLSIDTSKAEVARQALEAGVSLVNDVTALRGDAAMGRVVAEADVPVILMHMRGIPRVMQHHPQYRDVVGSVKAFLEEAVRRAEDTGISRGRILLDPGLGFGKTVNHNLTLMRQLGEFTRLGFPLVLGPSRKSFIGQVLQAGVDQRLVGTLACVAYAAWQGVEIVRVHDVKPAVELLTMWRALAEGRVVMSRLRGAAHQRRGRVVAVRG